MAESWEVYMIQAQSGKLYTGITNDLDRRLEQHSNGSGARFFHFSSPKALVFREKHEGRSSASKREAAIKKLSRKEKLVLIHAFSQDSSRS